LLPRALLQLSTRTEGDRIVPRYLTERDHTWLRALLDEHARFEGRKRSELSARLREPLPAPAPKAKLGIAARVLESLTRDRASAALPPPQARWRVFRAAAEGSGPREAILQKAADEANVAPAEIEAALFADLRGERLVPALPPTLSPSVLASRANLALVSSLLRRAATVRITAFGNTRALVRHARLLGLICNVETASRVERRRAANDGPAVGIGMVPSSAAPIPGAVIDVSGPLALFRHTEVYGRALASLVPRVGWCNEFELVAQCALGQGKHLSTFVLRSGDPIAVAHELPRYDSRVEERFARDFLRAAPAWDLVREPQPVEAEGALVFPDFELAHRHDPERRWLLEIVGFWTAEYLQQKLARLRAAGLARLILCIDARRQCHDADFPEDARVIRY
jgi:predicted nuclease of restriction endonuclease-like RecB superfamily